MTSPYSSNLLQQTVDTSSDRRTAVPPASRVPSRSVTHVVAAPQPVAQPQVMYVQAPATGNLLSSVALSLLVILLGAVALVGAYYATTNASPSVDENAIVSSVASREAFRAGVARGTAAGRSQALENSTTTTALRTAAVRERAYAIAFRRGERAGRRSYRAPRYTGGGYRRSGYSYGGGFGNYAVAQAFGQAQQLANTTGAPVDVEIY